MIRNASVTPAGECLVNSDCQLPGFHVCGVKSCLNSTVFRSPNTVDRFLCLHGVKFR
jgi:hypothetical protein